MRQVLLILSLVTSLLGGCASEPEVKQGVAAVIYNQVELSERDLHSYAKQLAVSMFDTMPNLNTNNRIAVGSFLPETSLTEKNNAQLLHMGGQIQASMQTLFTQVGASIIEFRTSEQITLADSQDIMLTRNNEQLVANSGVDYFLTGTISQVERGFLVNARLIDLSDKRVVSAATEMIPANVSWQNNKVSLRDGMLYRSRY